MEHEPESPLQGLSTQSLEEHRARLQVTYEKSFALFRRADRVLLEIMADIQPLEIEQETAISDVCLVICLRLYKAMRSAVILIDNDSTVDAFTCVRNMMECYLALASLLKDPMAFHERIDDDMLTAREGLFKHVDNSGLVTTLDDDTKAIVRRKRDEYQQLKKQGLKKFGAYDLYQLTNDEVLSEKIYFLYRYVSNKFSHISSHSLGVDIKDKDGGMRWSGITRLEMKLFTKYTINTFLAFSRRLDARFLGDRYKARLMEIELDLEDCIKSAA